jgi:hypothetical protein
VEAIGRAKKKPSVFLQGSAIAYYGTSDDQTNDEGSPPGDGFLSEVVQRTEEAARRVEEQGVRCVLLRTAVVLDQGGGFLPRILMPYRFFAGGYPGSGRQWVSWIHRADEVRAITYLLENKNLEGPFNLAAPEPRRIRDFCLQLGNAINRPTWFKFPASLMKLVFGEMADEVLLSGQKVVPNKLLQAGFEFRFQDLDSALNDILSRDSQHG